MNIWLIFLLGGALTFGMRFSLIYLFGKYEIPEWLRGALRLVPPAVLSAIVFPELLIQSGQFQLTITNFHLLAGIVAVIIAWKTKNTLLTILAGMAVLLFLQLAI